jgi:hypothetical protein
VASALWACGVQNPGEFWAGKLDIYAPCILAKKTRQPFLNGESETTEVLELVYIDVCGPTEKRSKGEGRFFATFTNDYGKLLVGIYHVRRRAKLWS